MSKTIRVRIAVAVDADGSWYPFRSAETARRSSATHDNCHVVFVEADVPIPPEPQTVSGVISGAPNAPLR